MAEWRDHLTGGIGWRERPGDGPVLVCLHGIGSRANSWQALAEGLPGWRVVAWDAPGYGASRPMTMDWPVAQDYAESLERLTKAIGLTEFHLVGHSLGTLIAASYARNYPQPLKSLTLVSCAQGGGVVPGSALAAAHQARINDLQASGAEHFSETRSPRLVYRPEANPALVAQVRAAMATVTLPGYAQAVRMLAAGDLSADCAEISTGTAVVVGAEDIVTPPAQSRRAHAALKNPRGLTVVPGCGHALPLQAPRALAEIILAQADACADQGATR